MKSLPPDKQKKVAAPRTTGERVARIDTANGMGWIKQADGELDVLHGFGEALDLFSILYNLAARVKGEPGRGTNCRTVRGQALNARGIAGLCNQSKLRFGCGAISQATANLALAALPL